MDASTTRSFRFATKRFLIWYTSLFVLVVGVVLPLAKLIGYETLGGAQRIRQAVGKEVAFFQEGRHYKGTLIGAGYRFNDKWGWFDLYVRVRVEQAEGWTGLSPSEAHRVLTFPAR